MSPNKCLDCNRIIDKRSTRCQKCANMKSIKIRMKTRNQIGQNNPNYKEGRTLIEKYCQDCGIKLSKYAHYYNYERCYSCANKKTKYLKNHPNWQGGKSFEPYTFEFSKNLKNKIRKRDSFRCQLCNIEEINHINLYKKVLCVHHIDYDKTNCKEENLLTLCWKCNIKVNYNRKYWQKIFANILRCKTKTRSMLLWSEI